MKRKHTLIVGGTRGIGRVLVKSLTEEGHIISVIGRRSPSDDDKKIKNVHYWVLDLLVWNRVSRALDEIIDKRGKLDNLVFLQRYKGKEDNWKGEIDVSLTATRRIIDYTINKFDNKDESSIVIISSIAGHFIAEEQPLSYHIAKAGINQMVRYYAVKLGPKGIRINCISSGTIVKDESRLYHLINRKLHNLYKKIIPLKRMATSKDIANTVSFLCSQKASFITGQNIIVDGGASLQMHESLARKLASFSTIKGKR